MCVVCFNTVDFTLHECAFSIMKPTSHTSPWMGPVHKRFQADGIRQGPLRPSKVGAFRSIQTGGSRSHFATMNTQTKHGDHTNSNCINTSTIYHPSCPLCMSKMLCPLGPAQWPIGFIGFSTGFTGSCTGFARSCTRPMSHVLRPNVPYPMFHVPCPYVLWHECQEVSSQSTTWGCHCSEGPRLLTCGPWGVTDGLWACPLAGPMAHPSVVLVWARACAASQSSEQRHPLAAP